MNPPSITGSSVTEDPENFIWCNAIVEAERVELVAYQMKGVAGIWFDQWKKNRVENAPVASWVVFQSAFMGRLFPCELREENIKEFLTLNPESVSVHENGLKFT